MALQSLNSLHAFLPSHVVVGSSFSNGFVHFRVQRRMVATKMSHQDLQPITRRTANFKPTIWSYDYIQSLSTEFSGKKYANRVQELKEDVKAMLVKVSDPIHQMELIDTLQRLGLSYHFDHEIKRILGTIHDKRCSNINARKQESLYAVALEFRLLRQHGFDISQEILSSFKDEKGNFGDDCKGILALYEAAYYCVEGENLFDAINFTTEYLKEHVRHGKDDEYLVTLANHALELPQHWRMLRLEARWFIDVYEKQQDIMNPVLLELAKLDFNVVQATHQEDLKHTSSWWRNTGFEDNLEFARDRLMENFFWTVGVIFEPQFGYCRRMSTKVNALITTIDDVYDIYGTLDELELFTDAVERWDITAIEKLPYYMKICFLALYNTINEMAFVYLKDQGFDIIKYLQREWANICKAYLLEANWYYSGYTPTLDEYIENAWVSISAPVILVHAYFLVTNNSITKKDLEYLEEYPNIIRCSSMILRLADDLGTSSGEMKRGDVPKSIQCYMHETGASEEEAREHIRGLINTTWLKINKDGIGNPHYSNTFAGVAMNLARMAQCMYQFGDGHGVPDQETKHRVLPTSLVRDIYKIMAKVLVNILKRVMDKIISHNQMTFVSGRQIVDSFVIAEEIIHAWRKDGREAAILIRKKQENLYVVTLEFRLLRQHGFDISQEGEIILVDAVNSTTEYLKEYVKHSKDGGYLSTLVNHALELPLHWRMLRLEARWFIDVYEKHHRDMNPVLIELAKLDFNVVQATHQEDLKHASTRISTKVNTLITTIDDVYDVYGTLDELELFIDAVERWDITAMERLPDYMKICYLALYNTINEMAFVCLKDQGLDIIKYLR
ncbi:hypothetical protein Ddye_024568 [Dipteronia dyeriana]|uniref:Uncharacterized protein n=1 Tax=Dipteronia dyeriana TaxID=168575 RepID=A0AAD9TW28_9ROSI|nr:hypothetical protein Ddye_024568 [Dipteronia dyeriana]